MSDAHDRETIRRYLLGEVTDEGQLRAVEERVFADEGYYQELLRVEADLADQYAGGELTEADREKVERLFLATRERGGDLSFALAVKEYLTKRPGRAVETGGNDGVAGELKDPPNNVRRLPGRGRIFSPTTLKIAASVLIVFALGAGFWRAFVYRSDTDRGLVALKEAYRDERPTEARISALDYAPPPNRRGGPERVNADAEGRAGRLLQYAVEDAPSAASYHALGQHLLAARHFDEALTQFDKASELDPNDAELQNDMGVALLEKAKAKAGQSGEGAGQALSENANALKHFERALELDGSLPAALFNRALALEALKAWEEAREAWGKYLERDSRSEWAGEARRRLERLNEQRQGRTSQNKEQVLREFLEAYRLGEDSRAWQVISRNREAITGKLVSAQLVDAYLKHSADGRGEEARDALRALRYAGELESKNAGDTYTAELARLYERSPPERLAALSRARELMRQGYEWCRGLKFLDAAVAFEKARAEFESAGGEPEIYFSEYWVGYSYHQSTRPEEGLAVLRRLISVCQRKGYKWLRAVALNASANIQSALKKSSDGLAETGQSLALSEQVGDEYNVQKNLAQLAEKYRKLNNHDQMLRYLGRCLERSEASWPGARQMWRNYDTAANAFQTLGNYPAAMAYAEESFRISVEEEDPSTIYVSLTSLAAVYGRLRNHERAVELARQGLAIGQKLSGTPEGRKVMAYCLLQLGHLHRQAGEHAEAIESYEQAIRIYDALGFRTFVYDAHKGKLVSHIALGDDDASERELRAALELVEANRKNIREEQNRNDYYNAEQAIYDLAVDFAYTRRGDRLRAFEYSEASRARTLLDLMRRPPRQAAVVTEGPGGVGDVSRPLNLEEIRQRMPDHAQILQYSVLPDKVVIWLIRKGDSQGFFFETREKKIAADELEGRVRHYLSLISNPTRGSDAEVRAAAAALHDTLIEPVEPLLEKERLLCVVPDKILNHLPFESLVSPSDGRYLLADYPLIYSPSSSVFVISSEAARARQQRPDETMLSVGAPAFDREAFKGLPDLPSAEAEARQVGKIYGDAGTCLVGRAATREAVMRGLEEADIAHFASHYVVSEDSPLSSKLLLAESAGGKPADGVLTMSDLYGMDLRRTRLVVLAACQTGVERFYQGEGMIGMSRAFLAAGVPTAVASHWPVDSDATAELMVNFHRHRKHGNLSTAEALRRAQLDMLNRPGRDYQHPYYWAAFVLIGGYAPS